MQRSFHRLKAKAQDYIEDHALQCLLATLGAAIVPTLVFFSRWLSAKHTIALCGWFWLVNGVLCVVGVASTALIFVGRLGLRERSQFRAESDVKNVLRSYFISHIEPDPGVHGCVPVPITLNFQDLDQRNNLRSGSAKRHFPEVAIRQGYEIVSQGPMTIVIRKML